MTQKEFAEICALVGRKMDEALAALDGAAYVKWLDILCGIAKLGGHAHA